MQKKEDVAIQESTTHVDDNFIKPYDTNELLWKFLGAWTSQVSSI